MQKNPDFMIGSVSIFGRVVLSPMDGFSDLPYRSLAREYGSAMSITEFISCIDVVKNYSKAEPLLRFNEEERPIVFQIYDSDPSRILEAALILRRLGPDIIDVNMGCSAQAVVNRGAGAGLLKEPEKIAEIFKKLTSALDIPVTGKIRLGWDKDSINYPLISRIIEENGGQSLAVHARTKKQGLRGPADWNAIAEIKDSLRIPVIGNGGVDHVKDIDRMLAETNCDAVMVGRAAIGNPWIFARKDINEVSGDEVRDVVLEHLKRMQVLYGESMGLIRFRKHLKRYLQPFEFNSETKKELMTTNETSDFISIIKDMFSNFDV